jgi:nucleotide-binding universal stress UspA family protein
MFRKLLVPLDRSALAEQALGPAAAIARASHAEVDVVLVHQPLPFGGFGDAPRNAEQVTDENKYLEATAADLLSGASVRTTFEVLYGAPVEMICSRAQDVGADLVVMTSHGRTGLSRAWLGSVADGVVRRSDVPVLMLRPKTRKTARMAPRPFNHVLVPLDGSAMALEALASAGALARCSDARITLLRVVQPVPAVIVNSGLLFVHPLSIPDDVSTARLVDEAKQELADVRRTLTDAGRATVESHVVVADRVARAILDFARGHSVDVIAMATHGRGMSRLVVGSVADKVLRACGLPVLLYRPIGRTEPIREIEHAGVVNESSLLSPA